MTLFSLLYRIFYDLSHLVKSKLPIKKKLRILLAFTKILFKYLFLNPIFKFNTEKVLGMKFSFFSYKSFLILFMEIFVKNEYHFKTNKQRPIIVDCGTNIGMATIYFKWLYPNSIIYSFEPDKTTFNMLKKNIKNNNLKYINLYNYAISDENKEIDFYIDNKSPGVLSMSMNKNRLSVDKVVVKGIAFSEFIKDKLKGKNIDLLKMDIEGAEKRVFNDMHKANIFQNISEAIVEYHHNIKGDDSNLSDFLKIIEKNKFKYQIMSESITGREKHNFQDVIIYLYR